MTKQIRVHVMETKPHRIMDELSTRSPKNMCRRGETGQGQKMSWHKKKEEWLKYAKNTIKFRD